MKIIAKLDERKFPPIFRLVIYDAPHRRVHWRIIQEYRGFLRDACTRAGILTPMDHPIDLYVNFVNPTSPDSDNLLTALYRAMDGKTMKGPGILTDDGLINHDRIWKFFPPPKK
jgi:hypothetical protein